MITDVAGVSVGHWTDVVARTGCTVVILPEGTVASGEVRGGAPATREFDLLAPERMVQHVDAVVLSGGSAFGLAAADGVVRWCVEHDRGFATAVAKVPIVVGMCLFDLGVGDPAVRPTAEHGYGAAEAAAGGRHRVGSVGAGTGATVNKWRGKRQIRPGGLGTATVRQGELVVSALMAVNAFGGIDDGIERPWPKALLTQPVSPLENTTIGIVVTNAKLDKVDCLLMAQGGHDGLARAIVPAHARADGDAIVAAATGLVDAPAAQVRHLATRAVEKAIRSVATS
ncbi:MAG: P1 family peptidase [Acidimicrobiia bacterium]